MRTYLVIYSNKDADKFDESLILAHVKHLESLTKKGNLIICGPFSDGSGAVLILQSNTLDELDGLIKKDPFIVEGYYRGYEITEFNKADESNGFLLNS